MQITHLSLEKSLTNYLDLDNKPCKRDGLGSTGTLWGMLSTMTSVLAQTHDKPMKLHKNHDK